MKRKTKSATIPSGYLDAWARLFTRSPAELEEQRRASSPAMTGSKQKPCKGPISAPQSTQAAPAVSMSKSVKGARHGK
ncbi:hypothetical protein A6M27_12065 [Acidithiobacillus thiooxidans]|uniref:Uncharacterized protein n=1 Tax=Acidithiobacillus thiooxidans TaxID=930 RepID=A0A1C2ISA4_ACITH|nr:hypothetical protein A6P07_15405 [Acidithiobacillus thiooxidans]OCX71725.1 hypothetical protein A6O24_15140 [Acidithiobacillus thiooxidans]OCX78869.1 hypothetical protein A6O26_17535 [Acidithiobacillus thiooxidans]OCX86652.1 hypothetical protein A6M27_12065 [Acidithiobacillus thiooxidans]OFC44921.1 hypothetical protein BAE47_11000 [Acidithiobacillus thiooxidans]